MYVYIRIYIRNFDIGLYKYIYTLTIAKASGYTVRKKSFPAFIQI